MVNFLFSIHTITEVKQSNRQGGARAVDLPARSFDLARPGVAPPLFSRITSVRNAMLYSKCQDFQFLALEVRATLDSTYRRRLKTAGIRWRRGQLAMWCYVYWIDDDCAPLRLHQFFHKISTLDAPSSKICADIGGAELIFTQRMRKLQLHDDLRAYDGLGHGKVYQGPSTTPNRHLCTVGFYSQLICMNAAGDVVQLVIAKQCDFSRGTVIREVTRTSMPTPHIANSGSVCRSVRYTRYPRIRRWHLLTGYLQVQIQSANITNTNTQTYSYS